MQRMRSSTSVEADRRNVGVLVVDDNERFRFTLAAVVALADGFELVGEASSGVEATRAVGTLAPDLVVMDIVMPGMDGITAARSILSDEHAPLIVLTSVSDDALGGAARELGNRVVCVRKQELLPAHLHALWQRHHD
jgi:DNA-binding NarL/FixJ family response regulator